MNSKHITQADGLLKTDLCLKIIISDSKNWFWCICLRRDFCVRYNVERKDINK